MKTLTQEIKRWEKELKDLKAEGSEQKYIDHVELHLEKLYIKASEQADFEI